MKIDYEVDEKAGVYTPLPAGRYRVKVLAVEDGYSKAGDPKLNMKLGVVEHPDRWVFHTLTFIPKGQPGHGIAVHSLKCFGFSIDKSRVNFDSEDMVGKEAMADLIIEEYNGKRSNKVRQFDYLQAEQPAADRDGDF
jgi:hypothetical protein